MWEFLFASFVLSCGHATLMTVLDAIIQSLSRAGEYNRDDQVAPAMILWPDKGRQWEPLLPVLRSRLPYLLTLGPYSTNCITRPVTASAHVAKLGGLIVGGKDGLTRKSGEHKRAALSSVNRSIFRWQPVSAKRSRLTVHAITPDTMCQPNSG
jgi:hypothetical protein